MKRKLIQLGSITVVLVVCILGYFILSGHYDRKEKDEESANKIVVFSLDDYKNVKSLSYRNDGKNIELHNIDGRWSIVGDNKTDIDKDVVEIEMLSKLVEIIANEKIDKISSLGDYGFIKSKNGIAASTNTIEIKDANGEEYTLYIGNANPFDGSKYYMMVEGDDSVYLINSDVAEAFTKTKDDLEKEEDTTA